MPASDFNKAVAKKRKNPLGGICLFALTAFLRFSLQQQSPHLKMRLSSKNILPRKGKINFLAGLSPAAGKAVCPLGRKKCAHQDLNLKPADYESAALTN